MCTQAPVKLAAFAFKNNYLNSMIVSEKRKQITAMRTKFAPPYSIVFVTALEEEIL